MKQFTLDINPLLQGSFSITSMNLAFVFQVNCPGCFIYSIPLVNKLYQAYADRVGFLGISTAFEDFELNTEVNTRNLLVNGTTVGETKKYLKNSTGSEIYAHKLLFPVAFDVLEPKHLFLTKVNIEAIIQGIPNFELYNDKDKQRVKEQVKSHYASMDLIGTTFTLNQLKGTPSIIIFDGGMNVIYSVFGHQSDEHISTLLSRSLRAV